MARRMISNVIVVMMRIMMMVIVSDQLLGECKVHILGVDVCAVQCVTN